MTTTTKELQRISDVRRVLTRIVSGGARSISEACRQADVPRSTYYAWLKSGEFDELLSQMKQANVAEIMTAATEAFPEIFEGIIEDAKGGPEEGDKLSARDRDMARRTFAIYYEKFASQISQPATGESAADWLAKHASKFQPVLIQGSTVIIQGDGDVVEGEAEEVDG
jgi:hypothetical protein